MGPGRTLVPCRAQQPIFAQGDAADAVFYLQVGQVKLVVVSARGKEAVLAILKPQAFFGEGCLAGQRLRMATAMALTDGLVMRIEKHDMRRVLYAEPTFAELLMAYLLSRALRIEEDLIDQLFNASEKRLVRVLLLLAGFGEDGHVEAVIPRLSQETLAKMIGTTRSRVGFFLNKFRRLGFIDYNDGMHRDGIHVHQTLLTVVLND